MPTISVTNNTATAMTLPGLDYTSPVPAGGTVSFYVEDSDEYVGRSIIVSMIASGYIRVELTTDDVELRPIPSFTTLLLPVASTYPSGTVVFDSTRMKPIVSFGDIWRYQTTVTAGTTAALNALTNTPTNAIAYSTDAATLVRYDGANFVSCSLSTPCNVQAGVPAGVAGQLSYNTTTQSLMCYTGAAWDSICVAPTGAGAAPADAAAVAGGMYWDTVTNRLTLHNGAAWMNLPVVTRDTAANLDTLRGAVATAGQVGWSTDSNRLVVYTGAAWFDEATVGMKDTGAATVGNGVIVLDPTGFANAQVGRGRFQIYNTAAFGGAAWVPYSPVVRTAANLAAFPVVVDVPEGTLVVNIMGDTAGAPGVPGTAYLYTKVGAAWVVVA
jgi:hypothetical protein